MIVFGDSVGGGGVFAFPQNRKNRGTEKFGELGRIEKAPPNGGAAFLSLYRMGSEWGSGFPIPLPHLGKGGGGGAAMTIWDPILKLKIAGRKSSTRGDIFRIKWMTYLIPSYRRLVIGSAGQK